MEVQVRVRVYFLEFGALSLGKRSLPSPKLMESGRALYSEYCPLQGGATLNPKPPNLWEGKVQELGLRCRPSQGFGSTVVFRV